MYIKKLINWCWREHVLSYTRRYIDYIYIYMQWNTKLLSMFLLSIYLIYIRIRIFVYFFFSSRALSASVTITLRICPILSVYILYIHTYYIYTIYIFIDWLYTHDHVAVVYNSLLYTDMICFCVPELIDGRRVTWLSFVSCCHAGHLRLHWFSVCSRSIWCRDRWRS